MGFADKDSADNGSTHSTVSGGPRRAQQYPPSCYDGCNTRNKFIMRLTKTTNWYHEPSVPDENGAQFIAAVLPRRKLGHDVGPDKNWTQIEKSRKSRRREARLY